MMLGWPAGAFENQSISCSTFPQLDGMLNSNLLASVLSLSLVTLCISMKRVGGGRFGLKNFAVVDSCCVTLAVSISSRSRYVVVVM